MRAIVVLGNLSDGFRYVGPFDSIDAASDWGNAHSGDWNAFLFSPDDLPCFECGELIPDTIDDAVWLNGETCEAEGPPDGKPFHVECAKQYPVGDTVQ